MKKIVQIVVNVQVAQMINIANQRNECDVLIAVGMRFDDRVTGDLSRYAKQAKIIHVEIDPSEIDKNVKNNNIAEKKERPKVHGEGGGGDSQPAPFSLSFLAASRCLRS